MTGTVHATCVLVGSIGVLIRGPSGSGKSRLAAALIQAVRRDGGFAALVADDRVALAAANGRLIARPPDAIAGRIEVRGFGIAAVDFEPAAVVRLVVDLVEAAEADRMPPPSALTTLEEGVSLNRLPVWPDGTQALAAIRACIRRLSTAGNGPSPSI